MQYKTIVLELLQQRPQMHEMLRQQRMLLTMMDFLAMELKEDHEATMDELRRANPESDPVQFSSEALELAIRNLEDRLPNVFQTDEHGELSLDQAMAHILNHSSRG